MAEQAIITTPWAQIEDPPGSDSDILVPAISLEYTTHKIEDITNQEVENITPEPNQFDCRVTADAAVLDAIEADPDYTVQPGTRIVVGNGEDAKLDQVPDQAEYDAYRAQVAAVREKELDDLAWSTDQLDTCYPPAVNNRTWRAIIEQGREYKKHRRKRVEQNTRLDAAVQSNDPARVGYTSNFGGALEPHSWAGNRIQRLFTDGGNFILDFRDPITVPGVFKRVKIVHKTEDTPAAFRPEDAELGGGNSRLTWPTPFHFTDGERYRIKFVE